MDALIRDIKAHNNRIFDRVGWTGPIDGRKVTRVINMRNLGGDAIQVYPFSLARRNIVRNTVVIHGNFTVDVWAVNRRNNFGFYLYTVETKEPIKAILKAFYDLHPARVERAFRRHINPPTRRSPRRSTQ